MGLNRMGRRNFVRVGSGPVATSGRRRATSIVAPSGAPGRRCAKTTFAKGSRKATAGINSFTRPRSYRGIAATAKRS